MQETPQTAGEAANTAATGEEAATNGTVGPDVMPSMEELLKKAELAAQEHHDAWLRAKADGENIRKRAQSDIASAHKYAIDNFAGELLPVRDSLEAALATNNATLENMRSGVELTLKQLSSVFEKFKVVEINPAGQKFDPHKHQAINAVESDAEPNTVLQVFQKGYMLNERIMRPAMVSVAKAKSG